MAVTYEYDAWGREVAKTTAGTYGQNLYSYNKLKYRGYYFDSDLGLYYLNSRFYDPNVGRFLGPDNPEVVLASQTTITDKNLYAYCDNNPVMRVDGQGNFWDVIGDLWSLGNSVLDVIEDPTDPWAWASLGGDALDLAVPFFSGGGETVRVVKAVNNVVDTVDDTVDTAKLANRTEDVLDMMPAGCFVEGTLVATESGQEEIETICPGDLVWAKDPLTGEMTLKQVLKTYVRASEELIHIHVNGEEIITTPEHPFYHPIKGWTNAVHLRAGDILVLRNGEYVVIEQVAHEILESPVKVYNFEVEDFHTYYVSSSEVLVHNKCLVEEKGVKIEVRTSNEHGLPHGHVYGNGPNTTIGLDKRPMKNHPDLSKKQSKVIQKNWEVIKNGIIQYFPKK